VKALDPVGEIAMVPLGSIEQHRLHLPKGRSSRVLSASYGSTKTILVRPMKNTHER